MGMLNSMGNDGCQAEKNGYYEPKACKPDYEGMILREKAELERHQKFFDAVQEFVGPSSCGDTLNMFIGELYQRIRRFEHSIAALIKQQENDK